MLVGGQSRRFGRDKLLEPIPGAPTTFLVDVAITTLRGVFGPRVAVCGRCAPEISRRADMVIEDLYPGAGPLGGITSALESTPCAAVFVLAGDLPGITLQAVGSLLAAAAASPESRVVAARTDRLEPCIALYRRSVLPLLQASVRSSTSTSLHKILESLGAGLAASPIEARAASNVNTPDELAAFARHA